MNVQTVQRAFAARNNAAQALRALYDEAGDNELTGEQLELERKLSDEITRCMDAERDGLAELERAAELDAAYDKVGLERFGARVESAAPAVPEGPEIKRSLRDVLVDVARGRTQAVEVSMIPDPTIRRDDVALVTGTATDGAELIATDLSTTLIDYLQETIGVVTAGARVLTTSSGNPITIPTVTSHSTVAKVAEAAAFARSAPQFSTKTLNAYKYGCLVQISSEMLEDTQVNLVPFVVNQATEEIGRLIGQEMLVGDGAGDPNGLTNAATITTTSASTTEWTADELFDAYHQLVSPYRQNARWIFKDSTVLELRKLKDSTGNYLWQTGMVAGTPDTLLGKPVFTDDAMPATATGNASLVFGDISRAYIVRLVGSLEVAMSTDYAFDTDLVTWRFRARADGEIVDANAVCIGSNA